jgi:hypothetical protein
MVDDRSRYGLLAAAFGAVLLAVSVFLPWYGLSFTAEGLALAQRVGEQIISQYGNASLQAELAPLHANLSSLAGQQFASVSAHQVLHYMNVLLLVLAGLALLDALFGLARLDAPPEGAGAALALLGAVASACVAYRMIDRPTPPGGFFALSLREGAWLALLGSLAILAGGLWPRLTRERAPELGAQGPWSGLSGWTPEG